MEEKLPKIFIATTYAKFKGLCNCAGLDCLGLKHLLLGYDKDVKCLKDVTSKEDVSNYSVFIVEDHISRYLNILNLLDKETLRNAYLLMHEKTESDFSNLFAEDHKVFSHNVAEDGGFITVYAQVGEDITSRENVYEKVLDAMENALQTARNSQGQNGAAPSHTHIP